MREGQSKEIGSADRDVYDMTERGSNDVIEHDKKLVVTLDMACGGSVSGKEEKAIWVPKKLMIGLTKKEKEEDFLVFKGSKLPISRRRSKFMQRNINVSLRHQLFCFTFFLTIISFL